MVIRAQCPPSPAEVERRRAAGTSAAVERFRAANARRLESEAKAGGAGVAGAGVGAGAAATGAEQVGAVGGGVAGGPSQSDDASSALPQSLPPSEAPPLTLSAQETTPVAAIQQATGAVAAAAPLQAPAAAQLPAPAPQQAASTQATAPSSFAGATPAVAPALAAAPTTAPMPATAPALAAAPPTHSHTLAAAAQVQDGGLPESKDEAERPDNVSEEEVNGWCAWDGWRRWREMLGATWYPARLHRVIHRRPHFCRRSQVQLLLRAVREQNEVDAEAEIKMAASEADSSALATSPLGKAGQQGEALASHEGDAILRDTVAATLVEMVTQIATGVEPAPAVPCREGEYDVVVSRCSHASKSLLMNIKEQAWNKTPGRPFQRMPPHTLTVQVTGFRNDPRGFMGSARMTGKIEINDYIAGVNGKSTAGLVSFGRGPMHPPAREAWIWIGGAGS